MSSIKNIRVVGEGEPIPAGENQFFANGTAAIVSARDDGAEGGILLYGASNGGVGYVLINCNNWQARGILEDGVTRFNTAMEAGKDDDD